MGHYVLSFWKKLHGPKAKYTLIDILSNFNFNQVKMINCKYRRGTFIYSNENEYNSKCQRVFELVLKKSNRNKSKIEKLIFN